MRRSAPLIIAVLLLLGFGLKLDRAFRQPLGPQAAATESLARSLEQAGWHPLGHVDLLTDGSFTAQGFQRGSCLLEVALLPPGDQHLAVLRAAWGDRARFLDGEGFGAEPPGAGRVQQLIGHLGHALGLAPRPAVFGLAAASAGACPARLWQDLARPGS